MKTAIVKTEVKFVTDLLAELRNGRLRVPKFQRPFVWNQDKMRRLLDSIVRGYPIGSIFVWETSKRYENLARVGPVTVEVDQPEEPASVGYLLDGHQRLSTLMGTLAASDNELTENGSVFRAYYNLKTNEFEHTRRAEIHHFPLWKLMDTNDFLEQCEEIREKAPESAAEWNARARALVGVFQKCAVGL